MPRSLALALVLALPLGCERPSPAPSHDIDEPRPPPDPHVPMPASEPPAVSGTHVVVAAGSRFYPSADASQPIAMRSYLGDEVTGTIGADHVGWVMRLGALTDTRAEVTPLLGSEPADNCGRGMEGLDDVELTMWVDRSSLLPVTTAPTELRFDDGSALRLPAGIPILPASPEAPARVSAWGFELPIGKRALETGFAFDPSEPTPPGGPSGGDKLPQAALTLAGAPLDIAYFLTGKPTITVREDGERTLVTLRGRCVEVEALADPNSLGAFGHGQLGTFGGGGGYGGMQAPHFVAVAAGTTVRWPDGSVAGRMRNDARLYLPAASGEGVCGYVTVGDRTRDVALCFADEDTTKLPLGHVTATGVRQSPPAKEPDRLSRQIESRVQNLRVPCVSHALEAEPLLDVTLGVRVEFGERGSPAKPTLKRKAGRLDESLRACISEQLSSWGAPSAAERLDFELRLQGRSSK